MKKENNISVSVKKALFKVKSIKQKNRLVVKYKPISFKVNNLYRLKGANGCGKSLLLKGLANLTNFKELDAKIKGDINYWYCDSSDLDLITLNADEFLKNIRSVFSEDALKFKKIRHKSLTKMSKGEITKFKLLTLTDEHNFIILDEALHHLDVNSQKYVFETLKTLKDKIIVFVQHNHEVPIKGVVEYDIENDFATVTYGGQESSKE